MTPKLEQFLKRNERSCDFIRFLESTCLSPFPSYLKDYMEMVQDTEVRRVALKWNMEADPVDGCPYPYQFAPVPHIVSEPIESYFYKNDENPCKGEIIVFGESKDLSFFDQFGDKLRKAFKGTDESLQDLSAALSSIAPVPIPVKQFRLGPIDDGDLTSYAPRFGVFNKNHKFSWEWIHKKIKSTLNLPVVLSVRKQFMQLSTFKNLRF